MNVERTRQMDAGERLRLRKLQDQVTENILNGRERFPWEARKATREEVIAVLLEEVGKLSRCVNKLRLAQDSRIRQGWHEEAKRRMITVQAVTQRFWLAWGDLT